VENMTYVSDASGDYKFQASDLELTEIEGCLQTILGSVAKTKKFIEKLTSHGSLSEQGLIRRLRMLIELDQEILTPKQAKLLQASLNLGIKLTQPGIKKGLVVDEPSIAAAALYPTLGWQTVEKFCVLSLDIKHRLLAIKEIASGTESEVPVCPKKVFEGVILSGGSRCIIAHNHPSGELSPSVEDINLTKRLVNAGNLLLIPVLDHLIIGQGTFNSLGSTTDCFAGCST
jgi:DNA repair protein RadC